MTLKTNGVWLGSVVLLLALAACSGSPAQTPPPTQILVPSTETPTSVPVTDTPVPPTLPAAVPEETDGAMPSQVDALIGAVIADLAAELAVSQDVISVWDVAQMTWPDTADFGCAAGAEVGSGDVPGYRITLSDGEARYEYRTDDAARFVRCDAGADAAPGDQVIVDPVVGSLVDLARRDLASRLDLPVQRVFLVTAQPLEWPNAGLGCDLGDQDYPPTPVFGYQIILRVGQQQYFYHSDFRQAVYCPEAAIILPVTPTPSPEGAEAD